MTAFRVEMLNTDGSGHRHHRVYDVTTGTDYWSAVTDVQCPACGSGVIRWAEAGSAANSSTTAINMDFNAFMGYGVCLFIQLSDSGLICDMAAAARPIPMRVVSPASRIVSSMRRSRSPVLSRVAKALRMASISSGEISSSAGCATGVRAAA